MEACIKMHENDSGRLHNNTHIMWLEGFIN